MSEIVKMFREKVSKLIELSNHVKNSTALDKAFGRFTEEVIAALEQKQLTKEESDRIFSMVDEGGLASNNTSGIEVSKGIRDLLFEGQILHDLGDQHGADVEMMKRVALDLQK